MDRLKRSRERNQKKLNNGLVQCEQLLAADQVDVETLSVTMNRLSPVFERLVEDQEKIMDLLLDDEDTTSEERDLEDGVIEDSEQKFLMISTKLERLQKRDVVNPTSLGNSVSTSSGKSNVKLPKIQIRKFTGDLKDWQPFWSQFKSIDENDGLNDAEKMTYLVTYMERGSKAEEFIRGYQHTGDNYEIVVKDLKARFGNVDSLKDVYIHELNQIATSGDCRDLSTFFNKIKANLNNLKGLGCQAEMMYIGLLPTITKRLPVPVLRSWEKKKLKKDPLKTELEQFMDFLDKEVVVEENIQRAKEQTSKNVREERRNGDEKRRGFFEEKKSTAMGLHNHDKQAGCGFCGRNHPTQDCFAAKKWTLEARMKKLYEARRCYKCLREGHMTRTCKAEVKCSRCGGSHHLIICEELIKSDFNQRGAGSRDEEEFQRQDTTSMTNRIGAPDVLMQTVPLKIIGKSKTLTIRAYFDSECSHSYLLKKYAMELGYEASGAVTFDHELFSGKIVTKTHKKYKAFLKSLDGKWQCDFDVYDEEKICHAVPKINTRIIKQELMERKIRVPDPDSYPDEIGMLIGADVFARLMTGRVELIKEGLSAVETKFGWTFMGKLPSAHHSKSNPAITQTVKTMLNGIVNLSDLWELEKIGIMDSAEKISKQELELEIKKHFEETVNRLPDGRFEVALPWKRSNFPLENNRAIAMKRLEKATEKLKQANKIEAYHEVFREWKELTIVGEPTEQEIEELEYYLPHRAVIKENSQTTKIRPVFDASCQVRKREVSRMSPEAGPAVQRVADWGQGSEDLPSLLSLNDCFHTGPNLLELIPDLLQRFRKDPVGVIADIAKAFLQILVRDEDRRYLGFLWWEDSSCKKVKVFRHNRLVFGLKPSPYLLAAVIEYLLGRVKGDRKATAEMLKESFYVDNVAASVKGEKELIKFRKEGSEILAEAKFDLRMWESNLDPEETLGETGVLGLKWDKKEDTIYCNLEETEDKESLSKRDILSAVAKVFDPLGILAPVTLVPKLLLQGLWEKKIGWKDDLREADSEVVKKFQDWRKRLPLCKQIKIPRWAWRGEKWSLHTFCDASFLAYAAVVFLRYEEEGQIGLSFLMAKARVAPKKKVTINRLELIGCEIGSRLFASVKEAMKMEDEIPAYFWTDSSTALAWIKNDDEWGTFVGNRVAKIKINAKPSLWRHVPGKMNPADLPSRSCDGAALVESSWWEGPKWLKEPEESWPSSNPPAIQEEVVAEIRKTTKVMKLTSERIFYPDEKCPISTYPKMVRVVGWMMRFIRRLRKEPRDVDERETKLGAEEIRKAQLKFFFIAQHGMDSEDKHPLKVKRDSSGLLRVETKLLMRIDEPAFKFPVLLPSDHPITTALIRHHHVRNCHAGAQFLIANLREFVWILKSRQTIEKFMRNECTVCKKLTGKNPNPVAAPLPENRVRDASPFEITGIDLGGPLFLKSGKKVWFALFTCGVYRAVYLELLTSLSTDCFLLGLRRFIRRNRRPETVYTDNGTNFRGGNHELRRIDWDKLQEMSDDPVKPIKWIFSLPASPWWNGWMERLIRTVKDLLKRVLGQRVLNYEELLTTLVEVEAVINHRPLTYVFENDDCVPLTPAMFTRGVEEDGVLDLEQVDATGLKRRFHYRQKLMKDLKERFRKEYLGLLVQRQQKEDKIPINVGDVVLIGVDNLKRQNWPVGQVLEIIAGRDGVSRVAKLKVKNGFVTKPFQRLYPLEIYDRKGSEIPTAEIIKRTRSGREVKTVQRLNYKN